MTLEQKVIIEHFITPKAEGYQEWLLIKAKSMSKIDLRIRRFHEVIGLDCPESALQALGTWIKGRRKVAATGNIIDAQSGLRIYRSTLEERYGADSVYIAFGLVRPVQCVYDTYLLRDNMTPGNQTLLPAQRRKSSTETASGIDYVYNDSSGDSDGGEEPLAAPTGGAATAPIVHTRGEEASASFVLASLSTAGSEIAPSRVAAAGLSNLGNTCYLNSILQALTASTHLQERIEALPHGKSCNRQGAGCVLCTLEAHFQLALSGKKLVAPQGMVDSLLEIAPTFMRDRQEDAHEFLRLLIDSMQKCCRGPKAPAPTAFVGTASGSGLLRPGWGGPYHGHSEPKAYPFSVFAGALQSSVTCLSCNAVSRVVDPIEDTLLVCCACIAV